MEGIRQWAAGICFAAAAAGLCGMIAPAKGTGKMLRLVMTLFFLTSVLCPLGLWELSPDFLSAELQQAEQLSQEIQQETAGNISRETQRQTAEKVFSLLEQEGIIPVRISIDMSDRENMVLLKVWLRENRGQEETIRRLLESQQVQVSIGYEEGESSHGG